MLSPSHLDTAKLDTKGWRAKTEKNGWIKRKKRQRRRQGVEEGQRENKNGRTGNEAKKKERGGKIRKWTQYNTNISKKSEGVTF